jgi:predicted nucleotidyltransferase
MVTETKKIDMLIEETMAALRGRLVIKGAYLFGSHFDGSPGPDSDIDLAIYIDDIEQKNPLERAKLWASLRPLVPTPVELHLFPARELDNPSPSTLAGYVILHGRRVS